MTNSISKAVFTFSLMAGLLFTSVASTAFAQGQCRTRDRNVRTASYDRGRDYDNQRNRSYNDRSYNERSNDRNYDPNYDPYYDRNRNRNEGLKRTGIGAAIGAAGGGLMGGRKGVLIGGIVGAAGGYIYHKQKENGRRY